MTIVTKEFIEELKLFDTVITINLLEIQSWIECDKVPEDKVLKIFEFITKGLEELDRLVHLPIDKDNTSKEFLQTYYSMLRGMVERLRVVELLYHQLMDH